LISDGPSESGGNVVVPDQSEAKITNPESSEIQKACEMCLTVFAIK